MNESAARACRVDRRIHGLKPKVPRALKHAWKTMTQREKSKLTKQWQLTRALAAFSNAGR